MSTPPDPVPTARERRPAPLLAAASLTAVEGLLVLLLAAVELRSTDAGRVSMAVTTTLFFVAYGAALLGCARAVSRGRSWARSPIVLAQLIQLGVAWNYRSSPTTMLAVAAAVVAVVVLAGLLSPSSVDALGERTDAD